MWYAVTRYEVSYNNSIVRAGSIYQVRRDRKDNIVAVPMEGASAIKCGKFVLTQGQARDMFTKPTKSFNDAVEESIMQCEANYC